MVRVSIGPAYTGAILGIRAVLEHRPRGLKKDFRLL